MMNNDTDVEEFRKMVGLRIKVRRTELRMKQADLASIVGVRQAEISEWETGRRALHIEQADAIAKGLKTSVDHLIGEGGREF